MRNSEFKHLHREKYYTELTRSFDTRYICEIGHLGVQKYRTLKDNSEFILLNKVTQQFESWDNQHLRILDKRLKERSKESALELTLEAQIIQQELNNILSHTLEIDDTVNWDLLKDNSPFEEAPPVKLEGPGNLRPSDYKELTEKPQIENFKSDYSLLDKLVPIIKRSKERRATVKFREAVEKWEVEIEDIKYYNSIVDRKYQEKLNQYHKILQEWEEKMELYGKKRDAFLEEQEAKNSVIENLKDKYFEKDPNAINEYCEIVLNSSDYSFFNFSRDFELDYLPDSKSLVVEYFLPVQEDIPSLLEVKYISSNNEVKEIHISKTRLASLYDSTIYKIILRSIHEIFEADVVQAIDHIAFNGWVNSLDMAKGQRSNSCIASIYVSKEEFNKMDLSLVDPKLCFKGLKGVGSSKLSTLTPIQPIQSMDRSDKRFVHSKDISNQIEEGYNLAMMDWEDFEHLVRELFHKEFSSNGGEVKVTQSSRDGGVDAIAFDPDPIRGGKIVIQAKRYTNTVGVNAVRDLWGTTMNEGASKGILVTTSNFGADAYDFSKNKPLTLINGNHLLYLLEKHGYRGKIDLKEARENKLG